MLNFTVEVPKDAVLVSVGVDDEGDAELRIRHEGNDVYIATLKRDGTLELADIAYLEIPGIKLYGNHIEVTQE
jgi:hypothetical protein